MTGQRSPRQLPAWWLVAGAAAVSWNVNARPPQQAAGGQMRIGMLAFVEGKFRDVLKKSELPALIQ